MVSLCVTGVSVQSKFEEIRKSNQAAAQRLVETRISSSSSEDDDDDGGACDHEDGKRGKVLASTFTTYTNQTGEPGVTIVTAGYMLLQFSFIVQKLNLSLYNKLISEGQSCWQVTEPG